MSKISNINPSTNLTIKFVRGLQNYNLTFEELVNNNWKYCGGNTGRHLKYFRLCCKDEELPDKISECVCGHLIKENCYITDGYQILILGNCCIKKFIPKSTRTCEKCGDSHKNRIVNRCYNCRFGICDICNKECGEMYQKCYKCTYK